MYKSTLFSALIITSLVYSLPLTVKFQDNPIGYEGHAKTINDAADLANERIRKMEATLDKHDDPQNRARIEAAFGKQVFDNGGIEKIKATVQKLKVGDLPIRTSNPDIYDNGKPSLAVTSYNREGEEIIKDGNGHYTLKDVQLGSTFHTLDRNDQAGTLIHEAAHYLGGAGDDYKPGSFRDSIPGPPKDGTPKGRIIKITEETPTGIWKEAGYANHADGTNIQHDDIVKDITPEDRASKFNSLQKKLEFQRVHEKAGNMYDNADSYRVFASLCSRSLYRRALRKRDPVQYFLSKRDQCSLPPDYFAKKAAAKAAATKGVTDGTVSSTQGSKDTVIKPEHDTKGITGTTIVTSPMTSDATASKVTKNTGIGVGKTSKGTKGTIGIKPLTAAKSQTLSTSPKLSQAIKAKNATNAATTPKGSRQPNQAPNTKNVAPKQKTIVGAKPQPSTTSTVKKAGPIKGVQAKAKSVSKPVVAEAGPKATVKSVSKMAVAVVPNSRGKKQRRDMGSVLDELD